MPIGLSDGWNQIQFNLAEFCRRAYKKQYVEVQKLKINANIRLRRVYFTERLIPDDELPAEYKLYFPLSAKPKEKFVTKASNNKENKIVSEQAIKTVDIEATTRTVHRTSKTSSHSVPKTPSQHSHKESKIEIKTEAKIENKVALESDTTKPEDNGAKPDDGEKVEEKVDLTEAQEEITEEVENKEEQERKSEPVTADPEALEVEA
ncbi:uncharacterized protein LOC126979458 [Leptidea sinapis]|nr:uncharacterized protein LOC126979458 [Leptidea sinapis]